MARWSPQIVEQAAPSFVENLANALGTGLRTKEHYDQQRIANEDRARQVANDQDDRTFRRTQAETARIAQLDADAMQGIHPRGWTPPGVDAPDLSGPAPLEAGPGAIGAEDPTGDQLAAAMQEYPTAMQPQAPPPPTSSSGHPGGFDRTTGRFVPVQRLAPQTLPSGRVFDPNQQADQKLAQVMAERQAAAGLKEQERTSDVEHRKANLTALQGTPGFERLSAVMIAAAAESPDLYGTIVKNEPRAPVMGSAAWEAAQRFTAGLGRESHQADRRFDAANPLAARMAARRELGDQSVKLITETARVGHIMRLATQYMQSKDVGGLGLTSEDAESQATREVDAIVASRKSGGASNESTISDADLWEQKVKSGMSKQAATDYVKSRQKK